MTSEHSRGSNSLVKPRWCGQVTLLGEACRLFPPALLGGELQIYKMFSKIKFDNFTKFIILFHFLKTSCSCKLIIAVYSTTLSDLRHIKPMLTLLFCLIGHSLNAY